MPYDLLKNLPSWTKKLAPDTQALLATGGFEKSKDPKLAQKILLERTTILNNWISVKGSSGKKDICLSFKKERVYLKKPMLNSIEFFEIISNEDKPCISADVHQQMFLSKKGQAALNRMQIRLAKNALQGYMLQAAILSGAESRMVTLSSELLAIHYAQEFGFINVENSATKPAERARLYLDRKNLPSRTEEIAWILCQELNLGDRFQVVRFSPKNSELKLVGIVPVETTDDICEEYAFIKKQLSLHNHSDSISLVAPVFKYNGSTFEEQKASGGLFDNVPEQYMKDLYQHNPSYFDVVCSKQELLNVIQNNNADPQYKYIDMNPAYIDWLFSSKHALASHYRKSEKISRSFSIGNDIQRIPALVRRTVSGTSELDAGSAHFNFTKYFTGDARITKYAANPWSQITEQFNSIVSKIERYSDIETYRFEERKKAWSKANCSAAAFKIKKNKKFKINYVKGLLKGFMCSSNYGMPRASLIRDMTAALRNTKKFGLEQALEIARYMCNEAFFFDLSESFADYVEKNNIDKTELCNRLTQIETMYSDNFYHAARDVGFDNVQILIHSHDGVSFRYRNREELMKFLAALNARNAKLNQELGLDVPMIFCDIVGSNEKHNIKDLVSNYEENKEKSEQELQLIELLASNVPLRKKTVTNFGHVEFAAFVCDIKSMLLIEQETEPIPI